MKWLVKNNKTFELVDFPFFDILINYYESNYYIELCGNCFMSFNNFDDAKKFMLNYIFDKIDICNTFDEIKQNDILKMVFTEHNGNYKYNNKKTIEEQYNNKWLKGRCIVRKDSTLNYAIRFDSTVDDDTIKKHGLKVINKHIRKFKKEYSTKTESFTYVKNK